MICRTRSGSAWRRTCRRRSPGQRGRTHRIGALSVAFRGFCAPARLGLTCRRATDRSGRSRAASITGAPRVCGRSWRRCSPWRMPAAGSIGTFTTWMRPPCARISTALARAGMARPGCSPGQGSAGPPPEWFLDQAPPAGGVQGRPIAAVLTGGERHERIALEALLGQVAIRRPGRGSPGSTAAGRGRRKGYSSPTARGRLRLRRVRAVVPGKSTQRRHPTSTAPLIVGAT